MSNTTFIIYKFRDMYPDLDMNTIETILYKADNILLKRYINCWWKRQKFDDKYVLTHWEENSLYDKKMVEHILDHAIVLEYRRRRQRPWYEKLLDNIYCWDDDIIHIDYDIEHWDDDYKK